MKRKYFACLLRFIGCSKGYFRWTMSCLPRESRILNSFRKRKLNSLHGLGIWRDSSSLTDKFCPLLLRSIPDIGPRNTSIVHLCLQPGIFFDEFDYISIELLILTVQSFNHLIVLLQLMQRWRFLRYNRRVVWISEVLCVLHLNE